MDKQVINAKIRATIVPQVSGSIRGTVKDVVTGNIRGEIGRAPLIPQVFIDHLVDYNNPHQTTAEQVGAVPTDLRPFRQAEPEGKAFRDATNIYVEHQGNSFRMTLQQVKEMGTKIVVAKNVSDADFSKLDIDDYVYTEN